MADLYPILFSGEMVEAILAGQKTVTRRIVKLREFQRSETPGYDWTFRNKKGVWQDYRNAEFLAKFAPYGAKGDLIYVRESYWHAGCYHHPPIEKQFSWWKATGLDDIPHVVRYEGQDRSQPARGDVRCIWKKRPGIHMPRWASRITLRNEGVRIERLQDISGADIEAEGALSRRCECREETSAGPEQQCRRGPLCEAGRSNRDWFQWLWTSINGPESWEANPYVRVVNFSVVEVKRA